MGQQLIYSVFALGLLVLNLTLTSAIPAHIFIRKTRATKNEYKICVAEQHLDLCNEMVKLEPADGAYITCVPARDRTDCLHLIQQRGADFTAVEPEDMWVALNIPDEDFKIFDEIRTKEEPNAEFRYEGVVVVHKDLNIENITQIRGLKSCHTGVGRNVGYKIPITKLRQMGILGSLTDPELSPRENELKGLSELFSKACIVGKWSSDPDINKRLKKKYSNLCQMCEKPDVCDYPDKFSGYDGALRCLAHNGGEIAWTKVYYVKKFFGLPIGNNPAVKTQENVDKFAYLCPNGTKVPITAHTGCVWAARPWPGFLINQDLVAQTGTIHKKLKELERAGEESHAPWLEPVLTLTNKTFVQETDILSPKQYLDKANYTDVIERDYAPPKKTVRFCVTSDDENKKCQEFSKVAFSRNIRPQFDCIQQDNIMECLKLVRDNGADVITLDPVQVDLAIREYNLKPIVAEVNSEPGAFRYAVAVVKKDSKYKNLVDLRDARSCHNSIEGTAGYSAPLYTLMNLGLISKQCPHVKALANFFSGGSCLPGVLEEKYNPDGNNPTSLCQICAGNLNGKGSEKTKCANNPTESFYGCAGAFRCLATGRGDVAFVNHDAVAKNTDGKNKAKWAVGLKSSDFELICPSGGRAPISDYAKCYLAKIPPTMVVTNNAKNNNEIDEIRHAVVEAGQMFGKRSDIFRLFGTYNGKHNLLFKDSSSGLVSIDNETPAMQDFQKLLHDVRSCD